MSVYIEYVIIDNIIIDYILLYAVSKTLRLGAKNYMLWLGAAAGAALAVVMPLLKVGDILIITIKTLTAFAMTLVLGAKSFKSYIICLLLFFCYTFVLGGCIAGILFLFSADMFFAAQLIYNFDLPIGLPLGFCFLNYLLLIRLVKYIERKKHIYPFIRDVRICCGDREISARGFIDSGNRLYDDDGSPVILISGALAERILPRETLLKMYGGLSLQEGFKKKNIITAFNNKNSMYLFKIVRLMIYSATDVNTIENVSVAAAVSGFKEIDGCQVLLHGDLIK